VLGKLAKTNMSNITFAEVAIAVMTNHEKCASNVVVQWKTGWKNLGLKEYLGLYIRI